MTEQDPEPRVFVGIRLRPASLTEVDRIAAQAKVSRSEVLRRAFVHGLDKAEQELRRKPAMSRELDNIRAFHQPQNIGPVGGPEDLVCMECITHHRSADGILSLTYQAWPCNTMWQLGPGDPTRRKP